MSKLELSSLSPNYVSPYDPANGRWLTEDPIGYEGGLNLYGYCGNMPVGSVDWEGTHTLVFTGYSLKIFNDDGYQIDTFDAYSGKPVATKNAQDVFKFGPTIEGEYSINPIEIGYRSLFFTSGNNYFPIQFGSWGDCRVPLHPNNSTALKIRQKKRTGNFFFHGGDTIGSIGCIDVGHNEMYIAKHYIINHVGDIKVIVDYSMWNSSVPKDSKGRGVPWGNGRTEPEPKRSTVNKNGDSI